LQKFDEIYNFRGVNFGTPVRLEKDDDFLFYSFDFYEDEGKKYAIKV
jgi:hypothetical protein